MRGSAITAPSGSHAMSDPLSVGWHHITCGCAPDGEYGMFVCRKHLAVDTLITACQIALVHPDEADTRDFLIAALAKAGVQDG